MIKNLFDVGLKKIGWDIILLKKAVNVGYTFFGVFLNRQIENGKLENVFPFCAIKNSHVYDSTFPS
jgi:hypothetical protein